MRYAMLLAAIAATALAARNAHAQGEFPRGIGARGPSAFVTVLPRPGDAHAGPVASITAFIDAWPRSGGADPGVSADFDVSFGPPPVSVFAFASPFSILLDRRSTETRDRESAAGGESVAYRDTVLVETLEIGFAAAAGAGIRLQASAGNGWSLLGSAGAGGLFCGDSARLMVRCCAAAAWSAGGVELHVRVAADFAGGGVARLGVGAGAQVRF